MLGPGVRGSEDPVGQDPRDIAVGLARRAVLAVAKAHTLFSGAVNGLSPDHRALAEEAFVLLEDAVRDLRDVVARLEDQVEAAEIRAREEQPWSPPDVPRRGT